MGPRAIYAAADSPSATVPGFWERLWAQAESLTSNAAPAVVLLDEAHLLPGWAARLKSEWDRMQRIKKRLRVVATGSSALRLASGSRESLAGRFERLTLTHWTASSLGAVFGLDPRAAAELLVRSGSYPGAHAFAREPRRWSAYIRDAILEPAIGRDLLALAPVRRPALLRQLFGIAASSPAQIVSLQKIQGQLQDAGALETIAHYLTLLEEAYLVAALEKFSRKATRRRSAPPKLVTLSNALLAVTSPEGAPEPTGEPARFGAWVENACLAHAWNCGQRVTYWREEPLEVDAVLEGSWGRWALEVKTGTVDRSSLNGLFEFTRRFPEYRPLLVCDASQSLAARRVALPWIDWRDFLLRGPVRRPDDRVKKRQHEQRQQR
ncbi:MAG: ATP-binding protein [Candidatus Wallbacteria bacterium]|nr:ATP-binding protein [Candidatus Wallbacteria bacterium]